MAKQANGYLGGFSGKLGPAVGYRWKGLWCLRACPRHVHNPRTDAQQRHRTMFKEEVRLAGRMGWAVNTGLKALSDELDMTPQNLFVKFNQQAFSMVDGCFMVDYPTLCISAGPVAPVALTEVTVDEHNILSVSFEKNPMHAAANAFDNVHVWVWCPEAGVGYLANSVYRRSKQVSMTLPSAMEGQELHVYAFVQDEHGRCSNTAYGSLTEDGPMEEQGPTFTDEDSRNENISTKESPQEETEATDVATVSQTAPDGIPRRNEHG